VRSNRRLTDLTITGGSACAVMGGIAAMSEDVRGFIAGVLTGDRAAADLAASSLGAERLVREVVRTIGDYRHDQGPLMMFTVAALVLFVLMFRS
jgi:hypothetical protein